MPSLEELKVVISSPDDVKEERQTLADVIQKLNKNLAALRLPLSVKRWEDAPPGFWEEGVQPHLDSFLEIEDSDLFIGILWKKLGRTVKREQNMNLIRHTKHGEKNGKPRIMLYFNQKEYFPKTREDSEQQKKVSEFKDKIRKEGKGLYVEYSGLEEFEEKVDNHLHAFIVEKFESVVKEPRREQIKAHCDELLNRYSEFHSEMYQPFDASWRQYIESFPFSKILLQHLCTGHREIYALLDKNEAEFENGLKHLLQGFSLHTDSLAGVCEDCLRLYDKDDIPRLRELLSTCD